MLSRKASDFAFAPGLVIAQGGSWDPCGERGYRPGIVAFGLDGRERWHLHPGAYRWLVPAGGFSVDSTSLVAGADPEVVRRRMTRFFDRVSHCVQAHGGMVEKFAGDAVLAAFGVAQAHEDDAERAVRAGFAILEAVRDLDLQARIGIEAGEVVVDEAESTFATGEAVHLAARLQEMAGPGEILIGPAARRLTDGRIEVEERGLPEVKGLPGPLAVWRAVCAGDAGRPAPRLAAPLIGREWELELLANTFQRTVRDGRASLFTIYGEPGVGKSRLAREFVEGLEGAIVLMGRCLPYGEGITFWSLAEMIKAAAGIADDDPVEEAFRKLRACCEDEAVADLLGLASGVLEALEGGRSHEEITWAAREFAETLAGAQPAVLLFEDIHWAEEPLLQLIEHLADWVRAPLLLLCLARPELLDVRPTWGGGRVRSTAIELQPLGAEESEQLLDALLAQGERPLQPAIRRDLLAKTEGNPLFLEETIRMLAEGAASAGGKSRIPDTLQALIAARIDRLPPAHRALLRRAAVIGRVFWSGALAHLSPDLDDAWSVLQDLLLRDFVLAEPRSAISGEAAFRFKHVLIREVAYQGLSKSARADYHARFADWLKERSGGEPVEIRAYHLDQAVTLLAELDGRPPAELAGEAAVALTHAAKRALAREAYGRARKLALRAVELAPSLHARWLAARAAWRMHDLAAVEMEMAKVYDEARARGNRWMEGMALTALGEVALRRGGDVERAADLVDRALDLLEDETEPDCLFDSLLVRATISVWRGDSAGAVRYVERALAIAVGAGRKDLQTIAGQSLAQMHIVRLELDEAERLLGRALELAEQSGSVRARVAVKLCYGWFLRVQGNLDRAESVLEEARALAAEVSLRAPTVSALAALAVVAHAKGDLPRAEKLAREAVRLAVAYTDPHLPNAQATLAQVLAGRGKVEEAERLALEAQATAGREDPAAEISTHTALGAVRAAQGRVEEAEALLRSALAAAHARGYRMLELAPLEQLVQLLRQRGRAAEAVPFEERLAELLPAPSASPIA